AHPDAGRPECCLSRSRSREVAQGAHCGARDHPCGKWGEWYPDVLGPDGKLTTAKPKPYWQPGWLKQHDRLMEAIAAVRERVPLVMSGDLHAIAVGRMMRSGKLDFSANPINAVLTGPISTRPSGWPSARRGTGALPPTHGRRKASPSDTGLSLAALLPINRARRALRIHRHSCVRNHSADKRLLPGCRRTPRTPCARGDAADQRRGRRRSLQKTVRRPKRARARSGLGTSASNTQ